MTGILAAEHASTLNPERLVQPHLRAELGRRIADLEQMSASDLREEWRRLFRSDPPPLSRDLVLRALAYRLQERELGGLPKATIRQLSKVAWKSEVDGEAAPARSVSVRPGGRLVREWRGRTHTVSVTETGFEYAGRTFASLTQIAKEITGAHWSGPRFFGLVQRQAKTSVASADPPVRRSLASDQMENSFHG